VFVVVLESSEQTDQIVHEWYSSGSESGDRSELQQKLHNLTQRLAETRRRELEMNQQQSELMRSQNELENEKQNVKRQLEQMRQRLVDGYIRSREFCTHGYCLSQDGATLFSNQ